MTHERHIPIPAMGTALDRSPEDSLRQKLVSAERRYYINLRVLEEKLARIEALQELSRCLIGYTDPQQVRQKLVELLVSEMGVEKAFVTQPTHNAYEICAVRGYSRAHSRDLLGRNIEDPQFVAPDNHQKPLFVDNANEGTVEAFDMCQLIVCPLRSDDGTFHGHLTVGFSPKKIGLFRTFESDDIAFFEMVAVQVSAALQNLRLRDTFRKFVPKQFLDRLGREGISNIKLGQAEKANVTILFADIRSFTAMSEDVDPQRVLNFLNQFFEAMNGPIHSNDGFIDKFIGDAIMALFIDEVPEVAARNAVQAALAMQVGLKEFNERRLASEMPQVAMGIGVHSGTAIVGTVGSQDRMDSTVLGDTVNFASRIQNLTKDFGTGLIVSSQTKRAVGKSASFHFRKLDPVKIRGKKEIPILYEVMTGDASR